MKDFRAKNPYAMSARNINALLEKETLENKSGEAKPFRIAEAIAVDIDVIKEAVWVEDGEYAFGKFSIVAAGAKSISANFDQFKLPNGTELYVYNENGEMITGPITESENNENNFWGSWVYKGGSLTIDFKTPIESKAALKLHISSLAYGYKDIYRTEVSDFGESSACNINVICALGNGWENERTSVALILNGSSEALCSGAVINNTCNLDIPNVLTANHCFDGNTANWKFTFQAWSATCNPSQNANGITFNGSTLRARSAGSDFCLVELNQASLANTGITYAGWSRQTNGIQNTTIIHHPAGDVMKISRDDQAPVFATFLGSQEWQLVLDQGATDPGSSGAPYFDQNHRIIGQHHGINQNNADQCLNTNKFGGRFDVSWTGGGTNETRLSNWLDPSNSGAMTTNTRGIPFITSPTLICTVGVFTLQNQPAGTNLTWSSSDPNTLIIDPVTGVATKQNGYNGQVTVTASVLSQGACNPTTYAQLVWVGSPGADNNTLIFPSGQRGVDPVTLSPSTVYQFNCDVVPQASSFTWVLPSGFSFASGRFTSTPGIRTSATEGTYTLYCSANNACGSSWTHSLGIIISNTCTICPRIAQDNKPTADTTFAKIAVYPNPANTEFKIRLLAPSERDGPLYLMDLSGNVTRQSTIQKGAEWITMGISDIFPGMYYIKINDGSKEYYRKVLVQHNL